MAGKSGRGKNRGRAHSSSHAQQSNAAVDRSSSNSSAELPKENGDAGDHVLDKAACDGAADESKVQEANAPDSNKSKQGEDVHLYPVSVKTQSGEKLELQLNPGDSVMDIRQFLLDAPETCFFTCYDLILHSKDGSIHHLEDYHEIAEIADITSGGCSLEMIGGLYDERSIRAHVRRARELLSLSSLHSSLSTTYALQHEANNQTVAGRAEVPELDGLGFMEEIAGSLDKLSFSPSKETKCVESIVFSSFNPVPSHRRLVGDLIYLDIETLEGHKVCITGTTRTFYVNSSLGSVLDPRPTKNSSESFTLIGLLQKISPKFKKGFREILDQKAAAHPFESVQSLLPPNSWLGTYPIPEHKRDAARAEDSLVLSYGSELIGMQRDWNEELQSCREFPHNSFQERILRDRALYKVTCDFVDAATKGAIGVINRCIPPINPTDPECFHMYVHNNIFFSFAVDSDLSLMFKSPDNSIKSKSLQDSENDITVRSTSLPPAADVKGLVHGTDEMADPKDTITGSEGQLADAKDKQADIQMTDNEQATYASANNDLRGTKAYQEADISGLHNLAMAIIDYRGHRVVAQSIIPGILQGDKSDSLLYGSVDNGKKICWNEMFHAKVLEAAKVLHIKEHSVLDGFGNPIKLAAPVECKGIIGSDDRHYLLDLMRVTPRDANYVGEGSRFCVLRPELVSSFCQVEAAERLNGKIKDDVNTQMELHSPDLDAASGCESAKVDVTKEESETAQPNESAPTSASSCEDILLNPNVLTEFPLAGCEEEIATDEALVKKAGSYLVDVVIPKFVKDLNTLEVSPMDGQTLAEALHAHGINVRYLGKIAKMTKHLPHIWDLCVTEIIVRSAKHILKDILRQCEDHELGFTMSQFLNCFLGHDVTRTVKNNISNMRSRAARKVSREPTQNSVKGQRNSSNAAMALKHHVAYAHITSEVVWSGIEDFAKHKYQFTLPDDAKLQVRKVSTIRNLCQKLGISIAARKYDLDATCPFQTSDVLDLQPVVKHSVPVCIEAKDLIETGKLRLAEGMLNEAYSLFSEAFSILQQVTGPMHREVANCCRYLAMVLYHAGDMAGAIIQQHKELIINERCLGLDHPDTAHSYGNMALFYHGLNQTELALRYMSRTLLLLSLSCGSDHPDVAATFINVAMMYQDIGKMNIALRYLQEALKKNERLLGQEHIQTAVCYHALAIAFNCIGAYKLSLQHERRTYDILVKQLGEDDSRTRDSQNWINTFKLRDIQVNAQKQKGQIASAASTQKAIDILKAHPDLMQAFQVAAGGSASSGTPMNKNLSAAMMGEAIPRGRGVDERAARAAAEVRKKAAARGLLIRPQGISVQTLPQLTQLLNIINSGATDAQPIETNNSLANGSSKDDGLTVGQEVQTPVGLGAGLASLDSKRKLKSNSTS